AITGQRGANTEKQHCEQCEEFPHSYLRLQHLTVAGAILNPNSRGDSNLIGDKPETWNKDAPLSTKFDKRMI
ncbi:MAG TPA: hypothetical protein VMU24_10650, partial [Candidatus Acidoferrales bacterium]|nr:hypothetical protein [Candidatus Acidoferrales bacterium]